MTVQSRCNLCQSGKSGHHYPFDEHVFDYLIENDVDGSILFTNANGGHYLYD